VTKLTEPWLLMQNQGKPESEWESVLENLFSRGGEKPGGKIDNTSARESLLQHELGLTPYEVVLLLAQMQVDQEGFFHFREQLPRLSMWLSHMYSAEKASMRWSRFNQLDPASIADVTVKKMKYDDFMHKSRDALEKMRLHEKVEEGFVRRDHVREYALQVLQLPESEANILVCVVPEGPHDVLYEPLLPLFRICCIGTNATKCFRLQNWF